jgi:hypothetical protein
VSAKRRLGCGPLPMVADKYSVLAVAHARGNL